jgi:hypothetical protein
VSISHPKANITKYLLSTPSRFVGVSKADSYYLVEAYDNHSRISYSAKPDERIYRHYLELAVETPEHNQESLIIPDYTHIADSFCIALSVLFGKRFDSHGLTQQHSRAYIPIINNENVIYNKNLSFNSLKCRVDFKLDLDLSNFKKIHHVIFDQEEELKAAQSTFFYAARFYTQSLRQVEDSPELAFLSLITVGEILSAYFKYPIDDLIDSNTKDLLSELKAQGSVGVKLARKVEAKLYGISESFCKYLMCCLDDDFFQRSEAKNEYERLKCDDIKKRLKAAYNMRSQFVHAGKFQSNWMSVNYLFNNEEITHGDPVIEDRDMKKSVNRSPTFIGMERIMRYALMKFLFKTQLISEFDSN